MRSLRSVVICKLSEGLPWRFLVLYIEIYDTFNTNIEPTLKSPSLWNIGKMEYWKHPLFQHSKIPLCHYSVKNDFSEWTQHLIVLNIGGKKKA